MKQWKSFREQQKTHSLKPCATYWTCHQWKQNKVEQVKAYSNVMQNPKNPLHNAVKEDKGCRLPKGKSWLGQAEQSTQHVCSLTEPKQARNCENAQLSSSPTTRLCCQRTLTRTAVNGRCRSTNARRSQQQTTRHCNLHGRLSNKGTVWLGVHSQAVERTTHRDSGTHRITTISLTIKAEAVTHATQWLTFQRDAQITHAIILTDSMNPLIKGGV